MQRDRLLESLDAIEILLVVAFISQAHRFSLAKGCLSIGQRLRFLSQFFLQDLAPHIVALTLSLVIHLGKISGRSHLRLASGYAGQARQVEFLSALGWLIGIGDMSVLIDKFVDVPDRKS